MLDGFMEPITRLRFSAPTVAMMVGAAVLLGAGEPTLALPFAGFGLLFTWMDQKRIERDGSPLKDHKL